MEEKMLLLWTVWHLLANSCWTYVAIAATSTRGRISTHCCCYLCRAIPTAPSGWKPVHDSRCSPIEMLTSLTSSHVHHYPAYHYYPSHRLICYPVPDPITAAICSFFTLHSFVLTNSHSLSLHRILRLKPIHHIQNIPPAHSPLFSGPIMVDRTQQSQRTLPPDDGWIDQFDELVWWNWFVKQTKWDTFIWRIDKLQVSIIQKCEIETNNESYNNEKTHTIWD